MFSILFCIHFSNPILKNLLYSTFHFNLFGYFLQLFSYHFSNPFLKNPFCIQLFILIYSVIFSNPFLKSILYSTFHFIFIRLFSQIHFSKIHFVFNFSFYFYSVIFSNYFHTHCRKRRKH